MTILCLVRDTRDGSWALFSDCLITSEINMQGLSLTTPHRPNYGPKETVGFSEVAIEEKIGFIEDQMILGWAGERQEAVDIRAKIKARGPEDDIKDILVGNRNPYVVVQHKKNDGFVISMCGPKGQLHSVNSGNYQFIFAGSGRHILEGISFTAKHKPLGEGAENAAWAALTAVSRFMSEEMAGQDSQFYCLRTGGHYRIFYGHQDGIRQLHYSVNHWIENVSGEAVVRSIVIPSFVKSYECFVEFAVNKDWQVSITNAIALSPLLQNPRESAKLEIIPVNALRSELADCTFHVCWKDNAHETFLVSVHEPRFNFIDGFKKFAHGDVTINAVRDTFSRMSTSG